MDLWPSYDLVSVLWLEEDLLGECGHHTRHLSHPCGEVVICAGRKLCGDHVGHQLHHGGELHCVAMFFQHLAQGLDKPGAIHIVPPTEVTLKYTMVYDQHSVFFKI